ncbi:IS200/IS605 family transposase [Candidatus Woesearchaeota archaeon]|nr:IS200/IS605 family transposase [Candidatus Woesearchaeota archaeon]
MTVYQTHAYKHGVGWSTWHFQWVTKYRRKVFEDVELQKLCEIFLYEIAKRHDFAIDELEVALDHVHVVASLRPSMSPSHAVQLMKGYTARMLFIAEPEKLGRFYWERKGKRSLWGDGKFIASVGHITLQMAKDYVKNHEARHAKNHSYQKNPHPLGLGSFNYPG